MLLPSKSSAIAPQKQCYCAVKALSLKHKKKAMGWQRLITKKETNRKRNERGGKKNNKQPHFACRLLIMRVATTVVVLLIIYLDSIEQGRD